ncbi:hypothetical protein BT69DRAFT_163618 [Atractiella rhizophila]|nr:hypothetical protein BT69DRAFT_163618 [Atractiella rhizophila]
MATISEDGPPPAGGFAPANYGGGNGGGGGQQGNVLRRGDTMRQVERLASTPNLNNRISVRINSNSNSNRSRSPRNIILYPPHHSNTSPPGPAPIAQQPAPPKETTVLLCDCFCAENWSVR